jgi:hypothetical protein
MYVCVRPQTFACTCFGLICVYVINKYICICLLMYVYMYIHIQHIHTHMYVYVCIYVYTDTYTMQALLKDGLPDHKH